MERALELFVTGGQNLSSFAFDKLIVASCLSRRSAFCSFTSGSRIGRMRLQTIWGKKKELMNKQNTMSGYIIRLGVSWIFPGPRYSFRKRNKSKSYSV